MMIAAKTGHWYGRVTATAPLPMVAVSAALVVQEYNHWTFPMAFGLVALAVLVHGAAPSRVPLMVAGMALASAAVAALLAPTIGETHPLASLVRAMWFALMGGLTLLKAIPMTAVVLPAGLVTAATVWGGQVADPTVRHNGILSNANTAAGLLVCTAVLMLTAKHPAARWGAAIPMAAIAYTGSRWGVVVMAAAVCWVWARRYVTWPAIGGIVAVSALLTLPWWGAIDGKLVARTFEREPGTAAMERVTATPSVGLSALPQGPVRSGTHNTVARIVYEDGAAMAVVWVAASLWVVARTRGRSRALVLTLLGLSLMDMYVWQPGGIGAVWWVLLAQTARRDEVQA